VSTPVVYCAAPVGAATVEGVLLNVARAERWFRALLLAEPDVALLASWLPYVRVLNDGNAEHRARGIRDDHAIIERVKPDGIVLVGGRISEGMEAEIDAVTGWGGWVSDLTSLGAEPQPADTDTWAPGRLITWGRDRWEARGW
jgi:hypothetical protein